MPRRLRILIAVVALVASLAAFQTVRALFSDNVTSNNNTVALATLSTPNLGVPVVTGTGATATVGLSWTDAGFANEWRVLRLNAACGTPSAIVTTVTSTSYTDTPGAAGTYCYAIVGKYHNWLSALSNTRQVTVNPDAPAGQKLYLHNTLAAPTGNTSTQLHMPMNTTAPTATTLFNYSTNVDSRPGRQVKKDGGVENSYGDRDKFANWRWQPSATFSPNGQVTVRIWVAHKDWDEADEKDATLRIWIRKGSSISSTSGYSTLCSASQLVAGPAAGGTNNWRQWDVTFTCTTATTISSSEVLELKIAMADSDNGDDMMVAYDTTSFSAFIEFD